MQLLKDERTTLINCLMIAKIEKYVDNLMILDP